MVRLLLALMLVQLPLASFAGPSLSLLLEQDKQQLGHAFKARLIAVGMDKNLSNIDLSPLEENFGVIVKEYSGVAGSASTEPQQQLSIELYPRRTGRLRVPELFYSAASSLPHELEVLPAQSASGPITIEYHLATAQPWQRQQVLVTINITTPDQFARLETVDMAHKDHETKAIPATREVIADTTRLASGWVIFPAQPGPQTISLPPLLYHLQGTVDRRFYLPNMQLNVKPLPNYIPPLMPVGRVFVDSSIEAGKLLDTGDTYKWNIRLHSPELLSHLLPPVLRQISSDNNTRFLATQSRRTENITALGAHAEVTHTIPFQSLSTGQLQLPTLRLQYFDPVHGRVAVTEHRPVKKWSMASYWQLLIGTSFLLAGILLVKMVWKYWVQQRQRRMYMKAAIQHINAAETELQLRQALPLIARSEHWPDNLSIRNWGQRWNSCYSPSAIPVVEMLSSACYAKSEFNIGQIRAEFQKLLKNRKPNHRRFYLIRI